MFNLGVFFLYAAKVRQISEKTLDSQEIFYNVFLNIDIVNWVFRYLCQ